MIPPGLTAGDAVIATREHVADGRHARLVRPGEIGRITEVDDAYVVVRWDGIGRELWYLREACPFENDLRLANAIDVLAKLEDAPVLSERRDQ